MRVAFSAKLHWGWWPWPVLVPSTRHSVKPTRLFLMEWPKLVGRDATVELDHLPDQFWGAALVAALLPVPFRALL